MNLLFYAIVLSSMLTGLIWIVQRVTYPAMIHANQDTWINAHRQHTSSITPVVAPLMIAELVIAILLVTREATILHISNLLLVVIIWLSTFLIQVPIHQRLEKKYDLSLIQNLIKTNWIRTVAWSVKTIILLLGNTTN